MPEGIKIQKNKKNHFDGVANEPKHKKCRIYTCMMKYNSNQKVEKAEE